MGFLGKKIRLQRLMPHGDERYLGLTVDHAIARGVMPGLDDIEGTLTALVAGGPDAVTMHKGIAMHCFPRFAGQVPLVVKCTSFSPYQPDLDTAVTSVEECVRLGADAVSVGCMVGGDAQPGQLAALGRFAREAESCGMPLIAHIYPRGNYIEDRYAWENVAYAARCAAELGVDLIKTNYTGDPDSFAKVVRAVPSRVAVAGGEPGGDVESYLRMTCDVLAAGGVGVTYGRFVFQYRNPTALVRCLRAIVHEGYDYRQAVDYLAELENA